MKIRILSRPAMERLARAPLPQGTAVISIADWGLESAQLDNSPEYLLQVAIDDVDNDIFAPEADALTDAQIRAAEKKYHMLSREQAAQIADFCLSVWDKAEQLICQCEHGQSRSAAVAAAVLEYRARKGITVFASDRYCPNKAVFRRVLEALRERGGKEHRSSDAATSLTGEAK